MTAVASVPRKIVVTNNKGVGPLRRWAGKRSGFPGFELLRYRRYWASSFDPEAEQFHDGESGSAVENRHIGVGRCKCAAINPKKLLTG